jgi:hypothetical protein
MTTVKREAGFWWAHPQEISLFLQKGLPRTYGNESATPADDFEPFT